MSTQPSPLLQGYAPAKGRYDELWGAPGQVRPPFQAFLGKLGEMDEGARAARFSFVRDTLASEGVTYNVHADERGLNRLWELDPLPFILTSEEWQTVAAGVAQRARLLDSVLADLYGPQNLLQEGLLPPALVFGQRSFLWPCRGIVPPGGRFLHLYAADLARAPDGRFWVLSDRTRAPAGAGYALQNRLTLSRTFPDSFRELGVMQLAPFFTALQDALTRFSPTRGEAPLVVVLTPGPYDPTYFEQSFLARFLGFPLVEGQDLLVRGDAVYLKTLRGLRRVHAIFRRLDDDLADPVELSSNSVLGVPGLLHAARAGNVLIANSLGSGVLETNALPGFLPAICKHLLGERLGLPSIATWWCGEAPALQYTIEHLDALVIKPAYSSIRRGPIFGHSVRGAARAELLEGMRAQPHAYVAQEWVRLSHTPALERGPLDDAPRIVPRALSMRVFAVATPDGYVVLPGGLSRVAPEEGDVVSIHWGGSSKDTWITGDKSAPKAPFARPRLGARDVVQSTVDIPSRVGENLFWMGRYSERCEAVARLLRAALTRIADGEEESADTLASIADVCRSLGVFAAAPPSGKVLPVKAADFLAAVSDPRAEGSLAANVLRLQASANHVRERMSTDNWHVFNRLPQRLPRGEATIARALDALDEVMLACVSLAGFAMDDMTRDESWRFLLMGRRLERLTHLSGVVGRVLTFPPAELKEALEWLLEAANSIVTFRARYRRAPELLPVLHLVVFESSNPHSVMFQVRELLQNLSRSAGELGTETPGQGLIPLTEALGRTSLEAFEAEEGPAREAACADLAALLERAQNTAFSVSDELGRRFFSHAATPAPLGV